MLKNDHVLAVAPFSRFVVFQNSGSCSRVFVGNTSESEGNTIDKDSRNLITFLFRPEEEALFFISSGGRSRHHDRS